MLVLVVGWCCEGCRGSVVVREESRGSLGSGEPAAPCAQVRPLGVAVVLRSVARTPEGAAVAAASVRLPLKASMLALASKCHLA